MTPARHPPLPDAANMPYGVDPASPEPVQAVRRLDLYLPTNSHEPPPLLVWFHGGGLEEGDKNEEHRRIFARRLTASGIAVALANYRLAPREVFPGSIEDAALAVAWAVTHAASLGCNPAALHVGGESAGAWLCGMLAMDRRFLAATGINESRIAGFIFMSGQMTTHFTVRKQRGNWNGLSISVDEGAPLHFIRPDARPLLILVAENDLPARLEENRYFATSLSLLAGHSDAQMHIIPNRDHGSIFERCLETGDPAGQILLDFLRTRRGSAA